MTQADDVTINATTEHSTELARVTKEYVVLHDQWQKLVTEAKRYMEEAVVREDQAKALEGQVADAKQKLTYVLGGMSK